MHNNHTQALQGQAKEVVVNLVQEVDKAELVGEVIHKEVQETDKNNVNSDDTEESLQHKLYQ